MEELEMLRREIDETDEKICALLEKRFAVVKKIGEIKKREGLPVFNAEREKTVIEKVKAASSDEREASALAAIYRTIMDQAKELEK